MALKAVAAPLGSPVGGSGTSSPSTIPRWTGPSTLGDSGLIDNGTAIYTTTRNVGIGTASPGARLHSVAADGTYQFAVSGTTRAVRFLTNAAGANIEGVDPTLSASYQPLTIGGSTVTLANSGSPALTVNTSGNVGIGTASPGYKLDVAGVINTTDQVRVFSSATSADVRLNAGFGGTVAGLGTVGAQPFMFFTSNTERARIDSNGNIYGTSGTTGMTNGFFYIPAAAGAPTGVPTAVAGRVPMYYDTTNNQFYVYNGAWKKVTLA